MSPIKRGASDVTKIYRGADVVSKVYRGADLVFGGTTTTVSPAYVRASTTTTGTSIAKPAGVVAGDLLIVVSMADYGAAGSLSHPSGFTTLAAHDLGANLSKINVAYKVATSSEPTSYTIVGPTDATIGGSMHAIADWSGNTAELAGAAGAAARNPSTGSPYTMAVPAVTPKTAYGMTFATVMSPGHAGALTWAFAPPSGYTEKTDFTTSDGWFGHSVATRQWDSTSAAPSTTFSITSTSTASQGVVAHLAIPSKVSSGGSTGTPAVFPSVRAFTQKGEAGGTVAARTIAQTSPAPVAGDLIVFVVSMTSGSATDFTNMTIPSGFTQLNAHNISADKAGKAVTTENKIRMGYKVATASEPTSYGYNVPTSYSHRADLIVVKDWNNAFTPVATNAVPSSVSGIIPTNSGSNPDTYNLTPVTPHNDTGLLLMTMCTRTTTATTSHGFNWDWAGSGGLTEVTDSTGNNIQTMSTAVQQWNVTTAASGKQVVLNRSTAEDRQATGVSIIIPGTPASGGGSTGPTGGDYTNGSGGAKEDVTGLTYDNGVKSSTYNLYAGGLDWTKNVGLMIYGDGSGDFGLKNPTSTYLLAGTNGLVAVAKKHNMVLLTPIPPGDGCTDGDGTCWYMNSFDGTTTAQKIAWSRSLVDYIMGRYNIDKQRMVIAGYSSGAQWTTQYFGPTHAPALMSDGLAVAISYGGEPLGTLNFTTAFKSNVPFVWDVGDADPAYQGDGIYDAQSGYDWYRLNGFTNTELHVVAGGTHDRSGQFGGILDREITQWVKAP